MRVTITIDIADVEHMGVEARSRLNVVLSELKDGLLHEVGSYLDADPVVSITREEDVDARTD